MNDLGVPPNLWKPPYIANDMMKIYPKKVQPKLGIATSIQFIIQS